MYIRMCIYTHIYIYIRNNMRMCSANSTKDVGDAARDEDGEIGRSRLLW